MRESFRPAGYDFRSLYRDVSLCAECEGGSVYLGRGTDDWVVITDQGTLIDLLSEEDQAGEWERAIHVYSFPTEMQRNEFVRSHFRSKSAYHFLG